MKIKNFLVNLSLAGLVIGGLSLSACSSGSSSGGGSAANVPAPSASPEAAPTGYTAPSGTSLTNSTVYYSTSGTTLENLALPQGAGTQPLVITAPSISSTDLSSIFVQQFSGTPTVLVTSGVKTATVVNVASSSSLLSSTNSKALAEAGMWAEYSFKNVTNTSIPVTVAANGGAYIGISTQDGAAAGSFLAFQNTATPDATAVSGATVSACAISGGSTLATTIADTILTNNGTTSSFIGIGTDKGEVLIYGVSGSNVGQCQNLTNASKAAQEYSLGSAIIAVSFTGTSAANYGYFATASGQVWRIVANLSNQPQSFTQIGGAGSGFISLPSGTITALFSDSHNNVYAGSNNGNLYTLAPTNSSGGVNTSWTSVNLGSPVLSVSTTTNGKIVATTASGVYNVSFNGS